MYDEWMINFFMIYSTCFGIVQSYNFMVMLLIGSAVLNWQNLTIGTDDKEKR